jgi:hypothetical protein
MCNALNSINRTNTTFAYFFQWANLCGSYLVEARWFSSKYSPTLSEYLENARTSIGSPAALAHAYMLLGSPIAQSSLMDCFKHGSDQLIYWSSLITRLSDDLGTYTVCGIFSVFVFG